VYQARDATDPAGQRGFEFAAARLPSRPEAAFSPRQHGVPAAETVGSIGSQLIDRIITVTALTCGNEFGLRHGRWQVESPAGLPGTHGRSAHGEMALVNSE